MIQLLLKSAATSFAATPITTPNFTPVDKDNSNSYASSKTNTSTLTSTATISSTGTSTTYTNNTTNSNRTMLPMIYEKTNRNRS